MYRCKALLRFVRYHARIGVTYRPYATPKNIGYLGCYMTERLALAFVRLDGSLQFYW